MRIRYVGGVAQVVEDDGELAVGNDGEPIDARSLDFSDELAPPTGRERRTRLAALRSVVDVPRDEAFREYLRYGRDAIVSDTRAQSLGTGSQGGYLAPQSFVRLFLVALKQYDGIFDAATAVQTKNGNDCQLPLDDDASQSAAIVSESGTSSDVDAVFDHIAFGKTPTWRSGKIRASFEVVQDSAFDFATLLAAGAARRNARGIGAAHITTLLSQATLGKTAASATVIAPDELIDLVASVDPMFGQNGAFLMNFATFTTLRKLKGSTSGDYILPIDRDSASGKPTLFNMPVYLSPSMPAMTTGLKPIVFGDLSRFIRREVANSLELKTYNELYATSGQVGYESFWRVDGALAKAANSPVPVKYLQMA